MKRGISQSKSRRPAKSPSQYRRRLLIEGLESRQVMAGGISPDGGVGLIDDVFPRNVGSAGVDAFRFAEVEIITGRGLNDSISTAEFIPLGTGPGQQDTIDIVGSLPPLQAPGGLQGTLPEDQDYFAFDLRAGDILDLAGTGSVGGFDVFYSNGRRWFATDINQGILYPASSPLMDLGNVAGAQVIPETGRYYVRLASNGQGSAYTFGLRVYRPVLEQQPIGTKQKVFLDFDGATLPASVFTPGIPGTVRIPSLFDSLNLINLEPQDESIFIDKVLAEVEERFRSVAQFGTNGDFDTTGINGQFAIEFLNSRDHADPGEDPFVTKAYIGGTTADVLIANILGVSESLDIGNFDPSELVLLPVEFFEPEVLLFPRSNIVSVADAIAVRLATTIAHEVGHSFGLRHTDPLSATASIIDTGGTLQGTGNALGVGPDGIFGTADDTPIVFPNEDRFDPNEGYIGNERVAPTLSWVLSTGTLGGAVTGTVFSDVNRDGQLAGSGELGLGGVTVFVDFDNDGVFDPGETSTTTASNGTYSLPIGSGTFRIVAVAPAGFAPTLPSRTVTVGPGGVANVNLGFSRVVADITGTKWADINGNGFFDTGEPGIEGVFVYLDLDGDDRIDLGEPRAVTDVNGRYTINFPGPGTFVIREVVAPGFTQTFPTTGEHVVVFNGTPLGDNFNFGNLPTLDFGDAPDSYGTTLAAGGPSHGILAGLSIGTTPDRELNGVPSVGADGDDIAGFVGSGGTIVDDEDGVRILTPIGPGANATFEVSLTNTTGQTGFLQAWFDFNRDGDFNDAGERAITDATPASGIVNFNIPIPSTVTPGPLYSRFRYSLTAGLGVGGAADSGEVEDHVFTVQPSASIANNDSFTVTRNSQATPLDVLANDFETATSQLTIISIDRFSQNTRGTVTIANGGRSVFYTPPVGFTGRDNFTYTVRTSTGQTATATVAINVSFLSDVPIAVDDTFEVSEGSNNIALNVLDNDVPSRLGGVTIISVTPGSAGGQTSLAGGNQTIRYTPRAGFNGTEEFTYSISDTAGNVSSAKATVNLLPGSRNDDLVAFDVDFFDATNNTPITNVQVGDEFLVRVSVEDLRATFDNRGVFSAFLDLLYTDELVAPVPDSDNPQFNFDIVFGSEFQSGFEGIASGDADIPGLFNEVGSQRPVDDLAPTAPEGPIELFTIRMQAVGSGIAVFTSNPADEPVNETTLYNLQTAVTVAQQRLGFAELVISPPGGAFTSAVDDSFPNGLDSNGELIRGGVAATLDVTANDNLGSTEIIDEFAIVTQPNLGFATIGPNNTILYTPDASANGFDSFEYTIVTADGVRSSAQVTLTVGNAAADDLMEVALRVVDGSGNPITGNISAGSRFGLQVIVDDLRPPLTANPLGVFAAFADILYDAGIVAPSNTILGDSFDFDVVFGPEFGVVGAFGVSDRPGIIDEFGSFLTNSNPSNDPPNPALTGEPVLLATLFFNAIGNGTVQFTAGPADAIPLRESLLFQPAEPVPVSQIRYGIASVTVGGAASGEGEARQNAVNPPDVNDDGLITPMDALTVINELSRLQRAEGEGLATTVQRFTDVSGDGRVTPLDALQVINAMSRRNRLTTAPETSPAPVQIVAVDDYRTLEEVKSRRVASFSTETSFVAAPAPDDFSSDDSESEDDLLNLLADDVASVWQ
ncbi:MAG: Ig-like domain-containing protein [Planctomycetaceae bacterium]